MSGSRREDEGQRAERSAQERERARLEREARRAGKQPGRTQRPQRAPSESPAAQPEDRPPTPSRAQPDANRRTTRARAGAGGRRGLGRRKQTPPSDGRRQPPDADQRGEAVTRRPPSREQPREHGRDAVRRIQPQPPALPAAAAGELYDETERPLGIRRVRRPARPVMTPPGDKRRLPARRRRTVGGRVAGLLALGLLAVIVIGALMIFQPFGSAEGEQVKVEIPAGSSTREIGDRLAKADVVDSGLLFSIRATLSGKRDSLRSGEHTLNENMTYGRAITALSDKPVASRLETVKVTIPEGRSRLEIAPIAERAGLDGDYLEASKRFAGKLSPFDYGAPKGTRSLEGFLFPATYELEAGAPARDLVDRQLAAFEENFAKVSLKRAKRRKLTGYDVLIIASMVEREAKLERERKLIAAVIYNRLKDGTPLGIDATSRYELGKSSGALTKSELASESAYNTRKRAGLPPTPIGNPGLASIRAAAAPANVKFRYFVVKPGTCGEHAFSQTDAEFQRDAARYNQARSKAGNKSPTTC